MTAKQFLPLVVTCLFCLPLAAQDLRRPDTVGSLGKAIPSAVADELKLDGKKTQVVIYYANETRATDHLKQLAGWLTADADPRLKRIGERLLSDAKEFTDAVATEVVALRRAAKSDTKPFGVAVFTNATSVKGEFWYLPVGAKDDKYQIGKLALPQFNTDGLAASPLTSPQGMAAALVAASSVFSADQHSFLLVTKSHGNRGEMIAPMLAHSYEKEEKQQVLAAIAADLKRQDNARENWAMAVAAVPALDSDKSGNPILDSDKSGNPILDSDKSGNPILAVPESTVSSVLTGSGSVDTLLTPSESLLFDMTGPPLLAEAVAASKQGKRPTGRTYLSVPKPVYLSVIRAAGQELGMRFPVVFAESCKSEVSKAMIAWLREQPNVGNLYTSDLDGLHYTTIDYGKLFAATPGKSAGEKLDAALVAKYETDKAAREKKSHKK